MKAKPVRKSEWLIVGALSIVALSGAAQGQPATENPPAPVETPAVSAPAAIELGDPRTGTDFGRPTQPKDAPALEGAAALPVTPSAASGLPSRRAKVKYSSEGYYRTRAIFLTNLAPQDAYTANYQPAPTADDTIVVPEIKKTSYLVSRLRLMPSIAYGEAARLNMQIDALDDVVWGDNNGLSAAPLFATDTSNQHYLGGTGNASVNVKRAWLDFDAKVGRLRVGRMPSHWGMGLLANGGGTANLDPTAPADQERRSLDYFHSEDFGDKHFGSTTDRILFLTRPLTIINKIRTGRVVETPLVVGYAYDKLSEAPLLAFEPFERRFRPVGQQGFLSRGQNDDVNEHVIVAIWNQPDWDISGPDDELRFGFYGVMRTAKEGSTNPSDIDPNATCGTFDDVDVACDDTGSRVYIADLWWRLRYGKLFSEGEGYLIRGTTFGGVPFPLRNRKKEANIHAGVARFGWSEAKWEALLEVGHASGDKNLNDEHFTQRAAHPDFNVGLILFEETLRELSARAYGVPLFSNENPNGATGFFSNGGILNANYLFPKGRWRASDKVLVTGGLLMAWVDKLAEDGLAIFYDDETGGSKYLGTELDVGMKAQISPSLLFSVESGYLRFGKALRSQLPNAKGSFTLQSSIAFTW